MVTDAQVRKLMREMEKTGVQRVAAQRSGMDEKTARRYLRSGKLPSEMKKAREWRTRPNPFEEDRGWLEERLERLPGLRTTTLFEALVRAKPGRYQQGQLRTLQRQVRRWRGERGPDREVFFPQRHRPGERLQTDFTVCDSLSVTVGGEALPHLLCHSVLPYSNWESAVVCRSEAFLPLKRGLQAALMKLGRVPQVHQTDHSTAACHKERGEGGYVLNDAYRDLVEHYELKAADRGGEEGAERRRGVVAPEPEGSAVAVPAAAREQGLREYRWLSSLCG